MTEKNLIAVELTLVFYPETTADLEYAIRMLQEYRDNLSIVVGEGNREMDLIVDKAELSQLNLASEASGLYRGMSL
jgi:hypothetical protein